MLAPSMAAAAIRVFRLAGVGIGTGVLVAGVLGGIGGRIGAIDVDNVDFRLFGPPALGIILFSVLPFIFGVALADLVDRSDPYALRCSNGTGSRWAAT